MIYELRRYSVLLAKKPEFVEVVEKITPLVTKHGAKVIGIFDTAIGLRNELIWLLAFENISKRMECWENVLKEEELIKLIPTLPCDQVNVSILRPLDFSPMK